MIFHKFIYNNIEKFFKNFLSNPIEGREFEYAEDEYFFIEIFSVSDDKKIIIIKIVLENSTYFVKINKEEKTVYLIFYDDEENNSINIDSEIGKYLLNVLDKLLLNLTLYLTTRKDLKDFRNSKFSNVFVIKYDVIKGNEVFNQEFGNNEEMEINTRYVKKLEKLEKISVDRGVGELIKELNKNNIMTLYSCDGHKTKNSYVSLYCFKNQVNNIIEMIIKYYNVIRENITVRSNDICWKDLEDGRKFTSFYWKT